MFVAFLFHDDQISNHCLYGISYIKSFCTDFFRRDYTVGMNVECFHGTQFLFTPLLSKPEKIYSRGLAIREWSIKQNVLCRTVHNIKILLKSCMEPFSWDKTLAGIWILSEELLAFSFETKIYNRVSIRKLFAMKCMKTCSTEKVMEQFLLCVKRTDFCHLAC